jgi:hypothetical protein
MIINQKGYASSNLSSLAGLPRSRQYCHPTQIREILEIECMYFTVMLSFLLAWLLLEIVNLLMRGRSLVCLFC